MNPMQDKRDYHGMKLINDAIFVCGSHVAYKHELETCETFINGTWSDKKKKMISLWKIYRYLKRYFFHNLQYV